MQLSAESINAIYAERVRVARLVPPAERFFAGSRLFERSCRIMRDGIRHQFPDADEQRVEEILEERLALVRKLENRQ
jgi:hypothetical protein